MPPAAGCSCRASAAASRSSMAARPARSSSGCVTVAAIRAAAVDGWYLGLGLAPRLLARSLSAASHSSFNFLLFT